MTYCPLKRSALKDECECQRDECSWWYNGDCAVVSIAGQLEALSCLRAIAEK